MIRRFVVWQASLLLGVITLFQEIKHIVYDRFDSSDTYFIFIVYYNSLVHVLDSNEGNGFPKTTVSCKGLS